jgi:hypothetical protein
MGVAEANAFARTEITSPMFTGVGYAGASAVVAAQLVRPRHRDDNPFRWPFAAPDER